MATTKHNAKRATTRTRSTPNAASNGASHAMVPRGMPGARSVGRSGGDVDELDPEVLRALQVLKPGRTLDEYCAMAARGVDIALVTHAKGP